MPRVAFSLLLCYALAATPMAMAQAAAGQPATPPAATPTGADTAENTDPPAFSPEELEQLAAPVALYPDSLLAQVLMASTYPVEIVEADRWVKADNNAKLTGDALANALNAKDWDAAVKSLVNFPDVLAMMSQNLDVTVKLGDAFLAQQAELMKAVQKLRAMAKEKGNLESNQQQTVTVEPAAAGSTTQTIVIESASPEVVYVPSYDPVVVYGGWPYPSYPPYPYYPPGYVAGGLLAFGAGVAIGAAWGCAWGNCNWGGNNVDIDIDRNTNINRNIDRSKAKAEFNQRGGRDGKGTFAHDPSHRKGASYRDSKSAQKFGGKSATQASQARNAYRGKAEAGRQDIARGGADQFKGAGAANRGSATNRSSTPANRSAGASSAAGARPNTSAANRSSSGASSRPSSSSGARSSAMGGSNGSAAATRNASSRGNVSRSSSGASRSSGARSGGGGRSGGGRGGRR